MEALCYICIGSNYRSLDNFMKTYYWLTTLFPSIRFAKAKETEPVGLKNPEMFTNQMACFHTGMEKDKIIEMLKTVEWEVGRRPEDKLQERVCIDIDLLAYANRVLKPEDWKRDYVVEGLKELKKQ